MQQRLQLAQHRADAAGGEQILHVMRPGRLQIDDDRRRSLISLRRSRSMSMPARPATAVRCSTALVEPPIAISTRSAFSTDLR